MKIIDSKIKDCKLIAPDVFRDFRGEYVETWHKNYYKTLFPSDAEAEFVQDDFSVSQRHVLRGLHGDPHTWKLVQAPMGGFVLTVLDVRKGSPSYGQYEQFSLSDFNRWQVLIPAGCANGHLCLTEKCMFSYKQTAYYDRDSQFSYSYKSAGIVWPVVEEWLILSERDKNAPLWTP